MTPGERLAEAGRGLVGCRFRLHGRDPDTGLDCVGVLAVAMARAGFRADWPLDYALRSQGLVKAVSMAGDWGFAPVNGARWPGDVMMIRVGPCQSHLVLCEQGGAVIHAHAGLRRVVLSPSRPDGEVIGHWRLFDPQ